MFKKIVLGALAFLLFQFSSVATKAGANGQTSYQTILNQYSSGSSVPYAVMAGKTIVGQCFSMDTPTVPLDSEIVINQNVEANGSLPQKPERKVAIFSMNPPLDNVGALAYVRGHWNLWTKILSDDSSPLIYSQNGMIGEVKFAQNHLVTVANLNQKGTASMACSFYQEEPFLRAPTTTDCGGTGTTAQRIADCSKTIVWPYPNNPQAPVYGKWNLVSRFTTQSQWPVNTIKRVTYQVWQDAMTGLLWSAKLDYPYSFNEAVTLDESRCQADSANPGATNCPVKTEIACSSSLGAAAEAGINDHQFGIPTISEFLTAKAHGLSDSLPDASDFNYWTNELDPDSWNKPATSAYFFEAGSYAQTHYRKNTLTEDVWVRCVGR